MRRTLLRLTIVERGGAHVELFDSDLLRDGATRGGGHDDHRLLAVAERIGATVTSSGSVPDGSAAPNALSSP